MIDRKFTRLYARIAADRIYFLRFILEGYDGLATLSTISSSKGIVVLRFPGEAKHEVVSLLESLSEKLIGKKEKHR